MKAQILLEVDRLMFYFDNMLLQDAKNSGTEVNPMRPSDRSKSGFPKSYNFHIQRE